MCAPVIFPKGQAPAKTEELPGHVSAIAVDDSDRLWAAAEGHVIIIDADGKRTKWQAGAFPALAGEIEHITVVGAAPPLPEAPKPRTATLTGRVLVEGAAKAGVVVAVCSNPLWLLDRLAGCVGALGDERAVVSVLDSNLAPEPVVLADPRGPGPRHRVALPCAFPAE